MPLVIGLDIGTTTITAIAVGDGGIVRLSRTLPNEAETTSPADEARGYCEWDAEKILAIALHALRELARDLGDDARQVVGLAVTGQQHGVVVIDHALHAVSPFINWQDHRAAELCPASGRSYSDEAISRIGEARYSELGCWPLPGYMAATLFWLDAKSMLPKQTLAVFIVDFIAARLTSSVPVTDSTLAASAGVLNLQTLSWDTAAIHALGLSPSLFPEVRPTGTSYNHVSNDIAHSIGLPKGVPVFVGLGDHQASFLGGASEPERCIFINVGTGAQVAVMAGNSRCNPSFELRPFPGGKLERASPWHPGGHVYALLAEFFEQVGTQLFETHLPATTLFHRLNQMAARVPQGADGMTCEPFFGGNRWNPGAAGEWTKITEHNFTPGHMTRALLEGMARSLHSGLDKLMTRLDHQPDLVIGAGNGIRENPLFAEILAREFGRPVQVPHHREEAAYGAAIVTAVGAGLLPDFAAAKSWIRYDASLSR